MSMLDMTLREFSDALAGKTSVPGGGGASALAAALGTALGTMVCNYTLGKAKYLQVEPEIQRLMAQAEELRTQLLECIDGDAEAFEPLSRAYSIPKDDPSRAQVMEECLRKAASVPLRILELSCRGILLHRELAEKGSALMISDAGTGVVLCWGAMYGAAVNVRVNTKLMADREYADALNARVDELIEKYWKIADEVYQSVYGRYC